MLERGVMDPNQVRVQGEHILLPAMRTMPAKALQMS